MGDLFNILIDFLGNVLSIFYQFLSGIFGDGVSYGLSIILLTIAINIVVFPADPEADSIDPSFLRPSAGDQTNTG